MRGICDSCSQQCHASLNPEDLFKQSSDVFDSIICHFGIYYGKKHTHDYFFKTCTCMLFNSLIMMCLAACIIFVLLLFLLLSLVDC
jgi:hypothetical protein